MKTPFSTTKRKGGEQPNIDDGKKNEVRCSMVVGELQQSQKKTNKQTKIKLNCGSCGDRGTRNTAQQVEMHTATNQVCGPDWSDGSVTSSPRTTSSQSFHLEPLQKKRRKKRLCFTQAGRSEEEPHCDGWLAEMDTREAGRQAGQRCLAVGRVASTGGNVTARAEQDRWK